MVLESSFKFGIQLDKNDSEQSLVVTTKVFNFIETFFLLGA